MILCREPKLHVRQRAAFSADRLCYVCDVRVPSFGRIKRNLAANLVVISVYYRDDNTVYIVEGGQICYGSKRAWETCRDS